MSSFWAFILLIGPLIFVHELGHLVAAKLVDVKVLRFSIGIGPPLLRMRLGETEYCLAPLPLGGYVSMLGQRPDDDQGPGDNGRSLTSKPLLARFFVMGAGPLANLLLPVALYFGFFVGHTTLPPAIIGTVIDRSAASEVDLRQGDRVAAIDGEDIRSWQEMQQVISSSPERELRLQIERDGKRFDRIVTPHKKTIRRADGSTTAIGRLGISATFHAPEIGIIDPRSPAYAEGLRTGDIVTSLNGEPIVTVDELERLLELAGDAQLRLTFLRPTPVRGPLGTYLFYESRHAQILPRQVTGFDTGILAATTFIRSVDEGSPAAAAGIRPNDRIIAVDGHRLRRWEYLEEVLAERQKAPLELTIQSLGEAPRTVQLAQSLRSWKTAYRHDREVLWLGLSPFGKQGFSSPEPIRGRFSYALRSATERTREAVRITWEALVQMLRLERVHELGGVIAIFSVAKTAVDEGPGPFLNLMAMLSVNLGLINLLPIPVLDGGHLMFFSLEAIRRRPLGQRARELASAIGLVVIAMLLLIAARNDIVRYWLDP